MRVKSLGVEGFKAYPSALVEFGSKGITYLVGPNNAGKSALLSALDYLVGRPSGTVVRTGETQAFVNVEFALTAEERLGIFEALRVPDPESRLDTNLFRSIGYRVRAHRTSERTFLESYATGLDGGLATIGRAIEAESYVELAELNGFVQGKPLEMRKTGVQKALSTALVTRNRHDPLTTLFEKWGRSMFHFGALRSTTSAVQQISNITRDLDASGQNLPEVLAWVRTQEPTLWEQLADALQVLVPGVGRLQVPLEGQTVRVEFVSESGAAVGLKELGAGVEQLLLAAYVGICRSDAQTIVLEEPETSLHPDGQRTLLRYMRDWATTRQLIVSTHSTSFLDRANEGDRIYSVHRESGVSSIQQNERDEDLLSVLGLRPSDLLGASAVVLVEGDSDQAVIERWFGDRLAPRRIHVVGSAGGDDAWHAASLGRWMEAVSSLDRPVLFIRDRDELSVATVSKLVRTKSVWVMPVRELENYFLDPSWVARGISAALDARSLAVPDLNEEDVAVQVRNAADDLRRLVVLKRLHEDLRAVRALSRDDVVALRRAKTLTGARVADLVGKNLTPGSRVRSRWNVIEREVGAGWDEHWASWAPGSDVLDAVWTRYGMRYSKPKDSPLLASLGEPPRDLIKVIDGFVAALDD